MPTFQIRNRRTKMVLGEVTVADPERVLDELKEATGSTIEDIAASLGSTIEEAAAALDIVVMRTPTKAVCRSLQRAPLRPRRLFA